MRYAAAKSYLPKRFCFLLPTRWKKIYKSTGTFNFIISNFSAAQILHKFIFWFDMESKCIGEFLDVRSICSIMHKDKIEYIFRDPHTNIFQWGADYPRDKFFSTLNGA